MAKLGEGLTGRIREAARELGMNGKEFSLKDLGDRAGIGTYEENRRMHWMMKDLRKRGELISTGRGMCRLAPKKNDKPPLKNEVMWRFLRMNRTVTVEDLREVAGVSADYARQWLRHLVKREVVRALGGGKHQLVKDSLENPKDTAKAEKLRKLREREKERAQEALDSAHMKIQAACQILDELAVIIEGFPE